TWGALISEVSLKSAFRAEGPVGLLGWLALGASVGFSISGVLIVKPDYALVGEVLDKARLGVSVNITALGSSVDTGSYSACSTGGAGRGSIVFVKTVSNTKSFFLKCCWSQNGIGRCEWYILILLEPVEGGKDFSQKVQQEACCSLLSWSLLGFWYVRIEIVEFKSSGSVPLKYLTQQELTAMTTGFPSSHILLC
nr:hypothetical protein [Tanacetum cinerariifolium]